MLRICFSAILFFSSTLYAAEKIEASSSQNPAPAVKLSDFNRIEIGPVTMAAPYSEQEVNITAQQNLQHNFEFRTLKWLIDVNAIPLNNSEPKVLLVEPSITKVKSISTTARVWAGALAGNSRILVTMKLTDKKTGEVIATPEFYQHANAFAAAYTFGAADKTMIERVATLMSDYLKNNYDNAVGGPTGMEEK